LLWLVLVLVVLLNKRGVFTPDIKPEIYLAPGRTAANLVTSWIDTQQLGFANFNVGLAPVAAVVAALQSLGAGPALSVRVLHLLLLAVAAWGATRLYAEVAEAPASRVGRVLVGLLYVANPYTVVAGDTLAILLPYAFLPWQVLFLIRALRRPHGWRWPAAFALSFVPMSGMNAGVVPLLQLVYVPAVVWFVLAQGAARRRVALAALRCGLLTALVSLYWFVPAMSARGVGSNVLGNSETLEGIAGPSSFAEVLRGLGLWVMYGGGVDGPWQPGFTSYLTNPVVVVLSFAVAGLVAAAILVARGPVRPLALGMIVTAAVVMVGLHPPDDPSPVGRLMRSAFVHLPALGALRTTNKAGAVLALGTALLVAVAGAAVARRLAPRWQAFSAAGLVVVVVGSTWPAWSGGLFADQLEIPGYWTKAAAAVDSGSPTQRVWFLPGEVRSHYRWSQDRVDDIDKSLLSRPTFVHTTIPNASPVAANFQAAVDGQLQEGSMPAGAVAAAARYLGVSDILARNDLVWEQANGARPAVVNAQLARDTGLALLESFGRPGENTVSPSRPPVSPAEAALPPVQHYEVAGSRSMARLEPLGGSVLVDGDGWALAPLSAAGLLAGEPAFRYLGDLTPSDFAQALRLGTRLVVTDTNRRRSASIDQLTDAQGALLAAGTDPGPSRTLFEPEAQTVLKVEGGTVTASSSGGVFGNAPNTAPENAVDGDERTAWVFGDFGRAVGQHLALTLPRPVPVAEVELLMRPRGPATISRVRLAVGRVVRTVDVPPSGRVHLTIPTTRADRLRVRVLATRGSGDNLVGVDEIAIPGVQVRRVARLPQRLATLARDLDAQGRQDLTLTPIDVVLSRAAGTEGTGDDEETGLDRDFTLPQRRAYRLYGLLRPDSVGSDDELDRLLGMVGDVDATSSSRAFDSPEVRASAAVDGNPFTAWSPSEPVSGSWLELDGEPRRVTHIDVQQPSGTVGRVRILLDGQPVADAAVHQGDNRIPVPAQIASRLRLDVTEVTGPGLVQVSEVGFGGARMTLRPQRALNECVTVATLDGRPVRMRPVSPLTGVGPALFTGCGDLTVLAGGPHQLRAVPDWMPDELVLRDWLGDRPAVPAPVPAPASVRRLSGSHWQMTATLPSGPQLLVLGQNMDPRWEATVDGKPLGQAVAADGYSTSWIVDAPGVHTFDIRFGPQQSATAALAVSAVAMLLCLGLSLWPRRRHPSVAAADTTRLRQVSRGGDAVRWVAVVLLAWLLGGLVVGAAALTLAAVHVRRSVPPRQVLLLALVLLALTPVAFLAGNASRWGDVSPRLVLDNPWPGWLAGCALMLLCVGVWRQDLASKSRL
jgi:arabinofuranan 3-O-arabinosyltransferase